MAPHSKGAVLVTGLHGFTGGYIEAVLREAGYEVFGLVSGPPRGQHEYQVDIRDMPAVASMVDAIAPDYVIHLAAVSFVEHGDAGEIYDVNVKGTLNLIEALRKSRRPLRKLLVASSGNIYGASATDKPVTEDTTPRPLNHYGISKFAAELISKLASGMIPLVIARPFNYTGIGQPDNFIVPKLVTAFQNGKRDIRLGNIDAVRDFSDVRWMVRIYLSLIESGISDEAVNICSERGVRIRDVLHELEKIAGYQMRIETDETLLRAHEVQYLVGSSRKLEKLIKIPQRPTLPETLAWMYAAGSSDLIHGAAETG